MGLLCPGDGLVTHVPAASESGHLSFEALCLRVGFRFQAIEFKVLGFRVWGVGFRVWGLGFGLWGSGFGACRVLYVGRLVGRGFDGFELEAEWKLKSYST